MASSRARRALPARRSARARLATRALGCGSPLTARRALISPSVASQLWESYLAGAEYLAGPGQGVSLADFAFFPNLAYMVRLGLELEPNYPNLKAYFCRMCARKSILASWPPHWLKSHGLPCLSSSILPPVEGATREACEAVAASAGAGSVPPTDVPCSRMNTADRCPVSARDVVAAAARGEESPAKC